MQQSVDVERLCRICGKTDANAKSLFDKDHGDLLYKLQTTFSIVVSTIYRVEKSVAHILFIIDLPMCV